MENLSEMIEAANAKWYGWFGQDEPYNTACFYSAELSSVVVAPVSGSVATTELAEGPLTETYLKPGDLIFSLKCTARYRYFRVAAENGEIL